MWVHCKVIFFSELCFSFLPFHARACFVIMVIHCVCVLQWEERLSRGSIPGNPALHCNFTVKFAQVLYHLWPTCRSTGT